MTRYVRVVGYALGGLVLWVLNRFDTRRDDLIDPGWVRHQGLITTKHPTNTWDAATYNRLHAAIEDNREGGRE